MIMARACHDGLLARGRPTTDDGRPMDTVVAVYCVAVGASMAVWWAVELRNGVLHRNDRSRPEITLHVVAEVVTAVVLVAGGVVILTSGASSLAFVGLGLLLYAVVQSPGYFLERGERTMVWMFAVLVIVTSSAIVALLAV
jgi:hypothetical protein